MYPFRETSARKKRSQVEVDRDEDGRRKSKRVCVTKSGPISPQENITSESLVLHFKSRCDDIQAWQKLQEKAKHDEIAKALVCDVLLHNDSHQSVRKDTARAQRLSRDIYYWIASSGPGKQDFIHSIQLYISGIFLAQGIGIRMDQVRASQCILQSAALGLCLAQYYVGVWHRDGLLMKKNMEKAVHYFRLAASQGHPIAQNMFGLCLAKGQGVAADDQLAAEQYQLAAEQGLKVASDNLNMVRARIDSKRTKK